MNYRVMIGKMGLATFGKIFPLRYHLGGSIGNKIRCFFAKRIVKEMGENCIIERGAKIMEDCIFGNAVGIGPNSMIGPGTIFKGYSLMGPNVHIYTTGHFYDATIHCFKGRTGPNPVTFGENVWIGYGVIILPGVSIGNNTIIGAGSVVSRDIPSGVLAAGNPCIVKKVIDKEIFEEYENESIAYQL